MGAGSGPGAPYGGLGGMMGQLPRQLPPSPSGPIGRAPAIAQALRGPGGFNVPAPPGGFAGGPPGGGFTGPMGRFHQPQQQTFQPASPYPANAAMGTQLMQNATDAFNKLPSPVGNNPFGGVMNTPRAPMPPPLPQKPSGPVGSPTPGGGLMPPGGFRADNANY